MSNIDDEDWDLELPRSEASGEAGEDDGNSIDNLVEDESLGLSDVGENEGVGLDDETGANDALQDFELADIEDGQQEHGWIEGTESSEHLEADSEPAGPSYEYGWTKDNEPAAIEDWEDDVYGVTQPGTTTYADAGEEGVDDPFDVGDPDRDSLWGIPAHKLEKIDEDEDATADTDADLAISELTLGDERSDKPSNDAED